METGLPQIQQNRVGVNSVGNGDCISASRVSGINQFAQKTDARMGTAEGCVVLTDPV